MRLRISGRAKQELRRQKKWWEANRDATDLFIDEFESVLAVLREQPQLGRPYRDAGDDDVLRILMRTTRYHIYYAIDGEELVVLSVWSAVRGRGPKL